MKRETIEAWILKAAEGAENRIPVFEEPAFGTPIVGFGRGDDPLLAEFRRDIGPFYRLPGDWLTLKYGRDFDPKALSLISWGFPQTGHSRETNAAETLYPSHRWALNRTYGEAFQRAMARRLEDWLDGQGIPAVAPMAHPDFRWEKSSRYGLASNWSERHTAYLCGLGTFGLCDGLISPLGKAMRYGSAIAALRLEPTPRPYTRYNEYCLADRGCDACIRRCPAGAITREGGHDKEKCRAYQESFVVPYCATAYGFDGTYGCGLCQTGGPCERRIPGRTAEDA